MKSIEDEISKDVKHLIKRINAGDSFCIWSLSDFIDSLKNVTTFDNELIVEAQKTLLLYNKKTSGNKFNSACYSANFLNDNETQLQQYYVI